MIWKYEVPSSGGWTTLHARQKNAGFLSRGCLQFQQCKSAGHILNFLVKLTDLVVKFCFLSFPSAFRFVLRCHMSSLAKLISFVALQRVTKLKLTCPVCRFVTSHFGYNKARAEHKVRQGVSEHISEITGHDSILLRTQIKTLDLFLSTFKT